MAMLKNLFVKGTQPQLRKFPNIYSYSTYMQPKCAYDQSLVCFVICMQEKDG